jgi:hypothetical protein
VQIASAAGVSVGWLVGEDSENVESNQHTGLLKVPVIGSLENFRDPYEKNGSQTHEEHACPPTRSFSRLWLESETKCPGEALALYDVRDNDTYPAVAQGDTVVGDRRQKRLTTGIFLVSFEEEIWVSSVRRLALKKYELFARNPSSTTAAIGIDEQTMVSVLGRVVGVWRPLQIVSV